MTDEVEAALERALASLMLPWRRTFVGRWEAGDEGELHAFLATQKFRGMRLRLGARVEALGEPGAPVCEAGGGAWVLHPSGAFALALDAAPETAFECQGAAVVRSVAVDAGVADDGGTLAAALAALQPERPVVTFAAPGDACADRRLLHAVRAAAPRGGAFAAELSPLRAAASMTRRVPDGVMATVESAEGVRVAFAARPLRIGGPAAAAVVAFVAAPPPPLDFDALMARPAASAVQLLSAASRGILRSRAARALIARTYGERHMVLQFLRAVAADWTLAPAMQAGWMRRMLRGCRWDADVAAALLDVLCALGNERTGVADLHREAVADLRLDYARAARPQGPLATATLLHVFEFVAPSAVGAARCACRLWFDIIEASDRQRQGVVAGVLSGRLAALGPSSASYRAFDTDDEEEEMGRALWGACSGPGPTD